MNLYEKLNRLDDSLVESKRVVKKKKLTESYSNEMTEFMNWIQDYRNGAIWNDFTAEFESEQDPDISVVLTWLEDFDEDAYYDYVASDTYDDDIDEMLTESTEQHELSTLVKDSINHLVNNLGKDPMADDFGDDVCADLEDNYDIYVPENPVKYADWCDAVMSEVSRQLNNKEEKLTEARNNKLQSIADQIVKYAEEHPESLRNFTYMYDYIDNLSQEGRFEIPAKVGQFVLEDPENVTEEEAEKFIDMLLDETDVSDKLIKVKRAAQKSAWNELRNRFPSI